MRLFVAVTLPEGLRERLSDLGHGLPGARWVAAENLHLTLRFIGEVDGADARDIDESLVAIRAPAFQLALQGFGLFGDKRRPRALWAGVGASDELTRLQEKVEQAVVRAGRPPERRKFKPHVTLARFASSPGAKLQDFLAVHALFRSAPFPVEGISLFSSFLSNSGAIYRQEAVYDLSGRAERS